MLKLYIEIIRLTSVITRALKLIITFVQYLRWRWMVLWVKTVHQPRL